MKIHNRDFLFSWAATFAAMFASDFAWASYVAAVKAGSAFEAAGWALGLFLFGAFSIISYTQNRWLLIPAAAGAWAGTLWGVMLNG